jgi:uncharacterized protein
MEKKQEFVYLFKPKREDFLQTITPEEMIALGAHAQYTAGLHAEGTLTFTGAAPTGAFGIVVLQTESEEAARKIYENDPAVQAGIVHSEFHPFQTMRR